MKPQPTRSSERSKELVVFQKAIITKFIFPNMKKKSNLAKKKKKKKVKTSYQIAENMRLKMFTGDRLWEKMRLATCVLNYYYYFFKFRNSNNFFLKPLSILYMEKCQFNYKAIGLMMIHLLSLPTNLKDLTYFQYFFNRNLI